MELALERVVSMVTGTVAAAGQQRKHDLEDTIHLRIESQAPRGVTDENHDETVPEKHPSQPQFNAYTRVLGHVTCAIFPHVFATGCLCTQMQQWFHHWAHTHPSVPPSKAPRLRSDPSIALRGRCCGAVVGALVLGMSYLHSATLLCAYIGLRHQPQ